MASEESKEAKRFKPFQYGVLLVHSSLNEDLARRVNGSLARKGFQTYAHYKEEPEHEIHTRISEGVKGIKEAVEKSRIILVLLTPEAIESHWIKLELILAFEKSVASGEMCIRLVLHNLSDEDLKKWMDLESIPKIKIDFDRDQTDDWAVRLESKIKEKVEMTDILPAGNVALGLVYNYFAGFLSHILPELKGEKVNYHKECRVLTKFIVLLPESCRIPSMDGQFGPYTIEKEDLTVLDIMKDHGDKLRSYNLPFYSIKKGETVIYFFGESPKIMETLAKLSEFVPMFDTRLQVTRFRQTLMNVVNQKRNQEQLNDTAVFVKYNDKQQSHAEMLWEIINKQINVQSTEEENDVEMEDRNEYTTVTNINEPHDEETAQEVLDHLQSEQMLVNTGRLQDARWNIFVLSKNSTTDPAFIEQYQCAITESIYENNLKVVPILTRGTSITDILPEYYRWTTIHQSSSPDYLKELSETVKGEPSKMEEFWPAGEIYEGLGWTYLLNYLPITLLGKTEGGRDLVDRFKDGMAKFETENRKCIPNVFIIIPKTCESPPPEAYFDGEIYLGRLEPVIVESRKHFLYFYQITLDNGESVCYAREYATPAVTLNEMAHKFQTSSGLNITEMYGQSRKLAEFLDKVMGSERFQTKIGDISKHCKIVYFGDENMGKPEMTIELKNRLTQCIESGNFIPPSQPSS